jgi:aminopeptidase N
MLREDLGDELFFKGLQKYYTDFRNSTALSKDFQSVMETVSGKDLDLFFKQWLWQPGHPVLDLTWKQNSKKQITIKVNQVQANYLFSFPLEIEIQYLDGSSKKKIIWIRNKENKVTIAVSKKAENILIDPGVKVLYE